MTTPDDDSKWHWSEGNRYALEGMKVLLALNGGAAIALMTFVGHSTRIINMGAAGRSLVIFGVGALLAAFVFFCGYQAQMYYGNAALNETPPRSYWMAGSLTSRFSYQRPFLCGA